MENTYQNPLASSANQPKPDPKVGGFQMAPIKPTDSPNPPNSPKKLILAVLGLAAFFFLGFVGVLISQKQYQNQGLVAPNAPESQPSAAIEQAACTLSFVVTTPTVTPEPSECGYSPCQTNNDCEGALICVTADDGEGYCAVEEYEEACAEDPSNETCCEAPTVEPELLECGEDNCQTNSDCEDDLICVTADDGEGYCAMEEYEDACADNPSTANCCQAPGEPELLACGEDECTDNFDCEDNLICITADNGNNYCTMSSYRSACADNPSTASCCRAPGTTATPTPTPTPIITTTTSGQPDLPEELPLSGPQDWLKYLQAGMAALGIGALLLLLL